MESCLLEGQRKRLGLMALSELITSLWSSPLLLLPTVKSCAVLVKSSTWKVAISFNMAQKSIENLRWLSKHPPFLTNPNMLYF